MNKTQIEKIKGKFALKFNIKLGINDFLSVEAQTEEALKFIEAWDFFEKEIQENYVSYDELKRTLHPLDKEDLLPIGKAVSKWIKLHTKLQGEIIWKDVGHVMPVMEAVEVRYYNPNKTLKEFIDANTDFNKMLREVGIKAGKEMSKKKQELERKYKTQKEGGINE